MTISRLKRLRLSLVSEGEAPLTQRQFADWLRNSQQAVNGIEGTNKESGPVSLLLDHLEDMIARFGVEVARDMVLAKAAIPPDAVFCAPDQKPFSHRDYQRQFNRGDL